MDPRHPLLTGAADPHPLPCSEVKRRERDIVPGPRVPLVHGTAATAVRISTREWQMVEHRPGEWRSIDDYSHVDNVIGKWVRVPHLNREGVAEQAFELDEVLVVKSFGDAITIFDLKAVEVIDNPCYLNGFERVIKAHTLVGRHRPAIEEVLAEARQFRLDMKRRVLSLGGAYRASVMAEFGWTEQDLDEAR